MKNKFTILGCGSSLGAPWITNYWGKLNKKNKKNIRTRCCAHIQYQDISILIDTSPDIKEQIKRNNIKMPYVVGVCLHKNPATKSIGIKKKYLLLFLIIPKINKQNENNIKIVEW